MICHVKENPFTKGTSVATIQNVRRDHDSILPCVLSRQKIHTSNISISLKSTGQLLKKKICLGLFTELVRVSRQMDMEYIMFLTLAFMKCKLIL